MDDAWATEPASTKDVGRGSKGVPMQREEFATDIGQVVAAMSKPWSVRVVDRFTWKSQAELSTPDGATLVIALEHQQTAARFSISGLYPQDPEREYQLYGPTLEITMAASRGPQVITRELERRLLPTYLLEYDRLQRQLADLQRGREACRQLGRELAVLIGKTTSAQEGRHWSSYHEESRSIDCRIREEDKVQLTLAGLSPHLARALLKLVAFAWQLPGAHVSPALIQTLCETTSSSPEVSLNTPAGEHA